MGCAGDPAAGVRAAAEAAGEHGEPAEEQKLLDPAAAPGQQWRSSQGNFIPTRASQGVTRTGVCFRNLISKKGKTTVKKENSMTIPSHQLHITENRTQQNPMISPVDKSIGYRPERRPSDGGCHCRRRSVCDV